MKNINSLILLSLNILILTVCLITLIKINTLLDKTESIKQDSLKIEDIKSLFQKEREASNTENIKSLEKSLTSIENTYQVYTSEYIKEMANRVAIAQAKLQSNPTLARSDELYKDLMAELEIDNYNFGMGHNVIEKTSDKDAFTNYNKLRSKLIKLGISEDKINSFILNETK